MRRTAPSSPIHRRPEVSWSLCLREGRLTILREFRTEWSSAKWSNGEILRSRCIEHGGGWGLVASVIFKITVTLPSRVGWVRFPHSPAISVVLLGFLAISPFPARAQQTDSARVGVPRPAPAAVTPQATTDSVRRPPMSPRRAFLTSLVLPGYAQTVFGRNKAALLFAVVEVGAIGMARKAAMALGEAKAFARDSVVDTYRIDPATGLAELDAATGQPIPATYVASRFTTDRLRAR